MMPDNIQLVARFELPVTGPIHANDIRRLCSGLLQANKGVATLFNYSKSGRPLNEKPMIRWIGGKAGFGIVGVGRDASVLVEDNVAQVRRALSAHYNVAVSTHISNNRVACNRAKTMKSYRCHHPILHKYLSSVNNMDERAVADWAAKCIALSMRNQADYLEAEVEEMKVGVTGVGERILVKQSKNKPGQHYKVGYKFIDYCSNVNLYGHWAAGSLTNSGHGAIRSAQVLPNATVIGASNG